MRERKEEKYRNIREIKRARGDRETESGWEGELARVGYSINIKYREEEVFGKV